MVQFEEKSFVVKVDCGTNPIENWQMLHSTLLELVRNVNTDNLPHNIWIVTDFIAELMPDHKTALKML